MSKDALQLRIGKILTEKRLTLGLAESCTGGLIGHLVTQVPGSSSYFLGGVICYSNESKERLLGVARHTLVEHGAVSAEMAREMARGARRVLEADIGLSVTGIAGPTGGTLEKPVGLTYVGLATPESVSCEWHVWQGKRAENKTLSAKAALDLLWRYLRG